MATTKRDVLLQDLLNIERAANRVYLRLLESDSQPDEELFAKVRDLREEIIRL